MKKFILVLVALLVTIGMVTPVVADDKVSISGEFRLFYYNMSEYDYDDTADETVEFFKQRLRVATKIAVADGVSINVRNDFTEDTWGLTGQNHARYISNEAADFSFDKAYLEVAKDAYTLRLGQQYFKVGKIGVVDHIGTGALVMLKSIPLTLAFTQIDEDGSTTNEGSTDRAVYAAQFGIKPIGGNVFVGYDDAPNANSESNVYVVGANFGFDLGAVKLQGELDIFGGAVDATTDFTGTQLYLDASSKLSDTMTLGGIFLYAAGDDTDTQVTRLTKFADWEPHTAGPFTTEFDALDGEDIQDFTGDNAGVMAVQVYASMAASADLNVMFNLMFAQPEDDALTTVDSLMMGNVSAMYNFAPNTKVGAQINYGQASLDAGSDPDAALGLMAGIWTKF